MEDSNTTCTQVVRSDGPSIEGRLATTFWTRLKGLIGTRSGQTADRALVLTACPSLHTFGMRYPVDVAFVDARGVVRKTVRHLRPNRVVGIRSRLRREGPYTAIERESSAAPWPKVGERVAVRHARV